MAQSSTYRLVVVYRNSNPQSLRTRVAISEYISENLDRLDLTLSEVDYEQDHKMALKYPVLGTPTILIFKNDDLVRRHLGEITAQELDSLMGDL